MLKAFYIVSSIVYISSSIIWYCPIMQCSKRESSSFCVCVCVRACARACVWVGGPTEPEEIVEQRLFYLRVWELRLKKQLSSDNYYGRVAIFFINI